VGFMRIFCGFLHVAKTSGKFLESRSYLAEFSNHVAEFTSHVAESSHLSDF
jgi:hypothetical protein